MIQNEKIFITGGAGFIGRHLLKRWYNNNEITIFSRDEAKHYFLKEEYPNVNFVIGDITDKDNMLESSEGHTLGIFAASMKQVDIITNNVEVATKTIIKGGLNSRKVCIKNGLNGVFISSDKSKKPENIYGAAKLIAGQSFILGKKKENRNTAIYGNIISSTGSVIPLIWKHLERKSTVKLFSEEMTRFILTADQGVDCIEYCALTARVGEGGFNIVPKIKSIKIKELFDIFKDKFGLNYIVTSLRTSEKVHEIMISDEERPRTINSPNGYYVSHPQKVYNNKLDFEGDYSSRDFTISKEELVELLERNNYFKP